MMFGSIEASESFKISLLINVCVCSSLISFVNMESLKMFLGLTIELDMETVTV